MTRVLVLSPSAVPGGAERSLLGLVRHLPEAGWEPSTVLLEHGALESWFEEIGIPVEVMESGRVREIHRTTFTVSRLAYLARRNGARVVISNQTKGHLFGGSAARLIGLPSLFWQHGIPETSKMDRVAAKIPARAIVVGSRAAMDAQRLLTPRSPIELIHPGVEVDEIALRLGGGMGIRRKLGLGDSPTVGIVGRLQPWKGQDLFLRAAAKVARSRPEARFVVIGGAILGWEEGYPASLERLVHRTPELHGRVHFVGHQEDVYPWYDALDVVVHASYGEPFGLVLVEAMALGRPLVATGEGGPTEIIEDEKSGLLVAPGDETAMAESVLRILGDSKLADRLSKGARQRASAFSASAMAGAWAQLLDRVAQGGDRHPVQPVQAHASQSARKQI